MLDELIPTLVRFVELVVLVQLPRLAWGGGRRLLRTIDTIGYFAVPGLMRFSLLSGVFTGLLLLFVNRDPAIYGFDAVFQPDGPWGVSFPELFTVWLDPSAYSPRELWLRVSDLDAGDPVTVVALLAAVLAGLVLEESVRCFGAGASRAILASALIWAGGVVGAVYVVCAAAWILHMMNVWAVVLLVFAYRYHAMRGAH